MPHLPHSAISSQFKRHLPFLNDQVDKLRKAVGRMLLAQEPFVKLVNDLGRRGRRRVTENG